MGFDSFALPCSMIELLPLLEMFLAKMKGWDDDEGKGDQAGEREIGWQKTVGGCTMEVRERAAGSEWRLSRGGYRGWGPRDSSKNERSPILSVAGRPLSSLYRQRSRAKSSTLIFLV